LKRLEDLTKQQLPFIPFHPIAIAASLSQVFHKTMVSKAALDVVPVES